MCAKPEAVIFESCDESMIVDLEVVEELFAGASGTEISEMDQSL